MSGTVRVMIHLFIYFSQCACSSGCLRLAVDVMHLSVEILAADRCLCVSALIYLLILAQKMIYELLINEFKCIEILKGALIRVHTSVL